jgi:hypothetical protein
LRVIHWCSAKKQLNWNPLDLHILYNCH